MPNWKLQKRKCVCGCGKTFRVLKGSPQRHASAYHDPNFRDYWQDRHKLKEMIRLRKKNKTGTKPEEEYKVVVKEEKEEDLCLTVAETDS